MELIQEEVEMSNETNEAPHFCVRALQGIDSEMPLDAMIESPLVGTDPLTSEVASKTDINTTMEAPTSESESVPPAPETSQDDTGKEVTTASPAPSQTVGDIPSASSEVPSLHGTEASMVGAEIVFSNNSLDPPIDVMTNLKWLSTNGVRKVRFCGNVNRLAMEKTGIFGLRTTEVYNARKLCIYEYPSLILILRVPQDAVELRTLLDVPQATDVGAISSYLVAETVVDPKACKLRLSTLTTVTSIENSAVDPRRRTCFELVTPTDRIVLSCIPSTQNHMSYINSMAFLETKKMELAVGDALYDAHCPVDGEVDVTLKHQLILGTLHSYVISGSQSLLDQAIRAAAPTGKRVPSHVIDCTDESGRTALHYACARRNAAAVSALIGAGCDATICLNGAATPCHLSAAMLDAKSLSTILSATFPRRPDPNALDDHGRTPMYVAIVEGCKVDKYCDAALGRCLQALEAWDGQILVKGTASRLPHPVVLLASEWRCGCIAAVLGHVPFRYPLPVPGISVGALYHYPIHTAIVSLRQKILSITPGDKTFRISDPEKQNLIRTLSIFLEHGFEPNERIEGSLQSLNDDENLSQFFGFSPIQILAAAALDLVRLKSTKIGTGVEDNVANVIAACVDRLLRSGARLNLDPPPLVRLSRPSPLPLIPDKVGALRNIDRTTLKIESSKDILNIFGGDIRLKPAKKQWTEKKTVTSIGKTFIQQDIKKKETSDSEAPGGSDEKSCAICWASFGLIVLRKHRCRVTQRYVCEDCSTKRIGEGKEEHRLSDGQFLLAQADEVKQRDEKMKDQAEQVRERQAQLLDRQMKRQARKEEENAKKDSIFGGMMEQFGFGEEEDNEMDNVNSLQNTLGQTRDALNERGDKLNSLSDKTEKLMESSNEFERMARELERSQKGGFFW